MNPDTNSNIADPGVSLPNLAGANKLSFDQFYETKTRLAKGSYGTVYTCVHKNHPETLYAVKILDRRKLKANDDQAVFREVEILKELRQVPHVIRLIDFFATPETMHMVQVLAQGGDVFDRLGERAMYTEKDARELAHTLIQTIQALHSNKPYPIVHRDLKPENLLLQDQEDDASILLADFGFARYVQEDLCQTRCGTPAYVAPEVLLGTKYSTPVDMWSVGALLYMLIGGYPPFQGENHRALFRKVRAADFVFHESYWKNVSIPAKKLIASLLTVNPKIRLTAAQALESDWFHKSDSAALALNDLSGSLNEMRKSRPRRLWLKAFHAIEFAASAPFWNQDAISFSQQLTHWDKEAAKKDDESMASAPSTTSSLTSKLPRMKFSDVYDLGTKLRKGSYATVWECVHKQTKEKFAVKIISRNGLQPKDDEAVLTEVAIMQSFCNNKYVVQLMDFYEEEDFFYLVMEIMEGGDVFDRIVQMTHYTEKDARDLACILLKAVASIHKGGVAHRDVKPQNLLLRSMDDNAAIKIADFGFARRVHTPESLTSRVGTPSYVAPEVLKNIPHDERVDLWSVGVVIYVLLVGYPPFLEEDQAMLFQKIRSGEWEFQKDDWKHISKDAQDLIRGLLVVDPKERWSVEEALRSRWIQQDPNQLSSIDLSDSIRTLKLKRSRLRSLARAVMWIGKDLQPTEVLTQAQDEASEL